MALYRRPLVIGFLLLLCLAVGEFWLYSANRLGGYMHQRASAAFRSPISVPSSDIGGFPFRLKVSCAASPRRCESAAKTIFFGAEEAHGVASLFSPNHIDLTFSSPLVRAKADGAPLAKLRHDGMILDVAWSLSGLSQARLDMTSLDWRPESPQAGVAFNVQKLTATASPQSGPDAAPCISISPATD